MNEKNVNKYDDMLFLQIKLSKDLNPSTNLSVKNKKSSCDASSTSLLWSLKSQGNMFYTRKLIFNSNFTLKHFIETPKTLINLFMA